MSYTENGQDININVGEIIQSKIDLLDQIASDVSRCIDCDLYKDRNVPIAHQYVVDAFLKPVTVVFVNDYPHRLDNINGELFSGKDGELLNELLKYANLTRRDIFILNTLNCRPKNKTNVTTNQLLICAYYLYKQINIIQPDLVVTMGEFPFFVLVHPKRSDFLVTKKHGSMKVRDARNRIHNLITPHTDGIKEWETKVIVTYQPSFGLKYENNYKELIHDFKMIGQYLDIIKQKKYI